MLPTITDTLRNVRANKQKLEQYYAQFKTQVKSVVKEAKFFDDHEHCPTCDQDIAEEVRRSKKDMDLPQKAKELKSAMDQAEEKQQQYQTEIDSLEEQMASCLADQNTLNNNNQTISRLQRSIDKIQQDLIAMSENDGDMGQDQL